MKTFTRRGILAVGAAIAAAPLVRGLPASGAPITLRFGVLVDSSGSTSVHGQRQLLGIRYQADAINKAAGYTRVELLVEDTGGDEAQTREGVARLLEQKPNALIGTSTPWTGRIVAEAGQAAGVPVAIPSLGPIPTQSWVFRVGPAYRRFAPGYFRTVAQQGRTVALLKLDALDGPADREIDAAAAAEAGVDILQTLAVPAGTTELTGPVRELMALGPDVLGISVLPPSNGSGVRDARAAGWNGPICVTPSAGHPGFLATAGTAAEGVRMYGPWLLAWRDAPVTLPNYVNMTSWAEDFEAVNGAVGSYAGFGADAVGILDQAYQDGQDPAVARERLETIEYLGASGTIRMAPENHAGVTDESCTSMEVREGVWKPVE
ncbi:ABC transporter substrate-binding protein [Phytomonospora endophytica]|uniref:ABC-type branched-subunit amino acid transport system substrate-binding protein n=1 Tax=Phytomonospora endophytica TaxID=714109 RepID=A0A841FY82_9ACTN|nr:ABC transporter substrate-binding protein [Phytomonospora endophytica]MBB6038678.1 ABC-type branched-subunit amino acid transport system substrate-binding protein [Phytomonospora endophytica]GIG69177.1 hypothetical protein Pen01_54720 [Phytomonospora endophytica]